MVMEGDLADRLDLLPLEAVELGIDDEVVRVAVVLFVLDEVADVV
jgi:hypothetical protein